MKNAPLDWMVNMNYIPPAHTPQFGITAYYLQRNVEIWGNRPHYGADFTGFSSVFPTCKSQCIGVHNDDSRGNYVKLRDSNNLTHWYCHLKNNSIKIAYGQLVDTNNIIGTMGATGHVTGVHLHYEVTRPDGSRINPLELIGIPNQTGVYQTKDYTGEVISNVKTMRVYKAYKPLTEVQDPELIAGILNDTLIVIKEGFDDYQVMTSRIARQYDESTCRKVFRELFAEMQDGEMLR